MEKSEKRLQFLITLLEVKNKTKQDLAAMMDKTPQNISVYFSRDDMKLSCAQDMVAALGHELSVRLEKNLGDSVKTIQNIEVLVTQDELSRLAFLRLAMKRYGISRKELAEKLEISFAGVSRWFMVDDIAISYLFDIADKYDMTISFIIK